MEFSAFLNDVLIPKDIKYNLLEQYVTSVTYTLYLHRDHTPEMYPHMVSPDGSVLVFDVGYHRALRILVAIRGDFDQVKTSIRDKMVSVVASNKGIY